MDMIGIRKQITAQVGMGLLPLLGAATPADSGTHPRNEEAYDLYLRSVAVPHDAASNKEAIAMLERAIGMDPNYAPTWEQLGLRYYFNATYSTGGETMFQRSNIARPSRNQTLQQAFSYQRSAFSLDFKCAAD